MKKREPIKGFSRLSRDEKASLAARLTSYPEKFLAQLRSFRHGDPEIQRLLESFSENTVSNYFMPYSLAPNFMVNGIPYILPMVNLKIVYGSGSEVGILTTSTDNDTLVFYAVGYDSLGNSYPNQVVAWYIDSIGSVSPDTAESTVTLMEHAR